MSTNPRNPRYFPRMKVRGARRRALAPWQGALRSAAEMAAWAESLGIVVPGWQRFWLSIQLHSQARTSNPTPQPPALAEANIMPREGRTQ